jgi:Carboxypeptidase regulatory-like domain
MTRGGSAGWRPLAFACLLIVAGAGTATAQSLTEGSIEGAVTLADGVPVGSVTITLTDDALGSVRQFATDLSGHFTTELVAPGSYTLLAERGGYQPVRYHNVKVIGGERTVLRVNVVRRPPPITQVDEVEATGQEQVPYLPRPGQIETRHEVELPAPRSDLSEVGRNSPLASTPDQPRFGFTTASGGLPQSYSRLVVDGLPGTWMRHPGALNEASGSPVYPRYLIGQAQLLSQVGDVEGYGANGLEVSAFTRRGAERFRFEPYLALAGKAGVGSSQNPADSSQTSVWIGGSVSGALVPGKAQFVAGLHYEQVEIASADPWATDSGSLSGGPVALASTLESVAQNTYGTAVAAFTRPTVRSWKGGGGGTRVDWQLSRKYSVMARLNLAKWKEGNALIAEDPLNGSGNDLDASDFSGATALEANWNSATNEFRLGYRHARRDWTGADLPTSPLVGDGIAIGRSPLAPGSFQRNAFDIADAFGVRFGHEHQHVAKVGFQFSADSWKQDYLYGSQGVFQFGDLDQFAGGTGSYFLASDSSSGASFKYTEFSIFAQVLWRLRPGLSLNGGVRWEEQKLPPTSKGDIRSDSLFQATFGLRNNESPSDGGNFGPHLGLLWEGGPDRSWIASLAGGWFYGQLDPAVFSEVQLSDGQQVVQRALGNVASWPTAPAAGLVSSRRFALFNPSGTYHNPRTTKLDLEIRKRLPKDLSVAFNAGYHHTDYLLRRTDLNLAGAPSATTTEGRAVYGTLVQQGGMLTVQPGSNRRVTAYDLVSGFSPTGFSNYYEAGISLERRLPSGLSLGAGYTYSHTRDNWLRSWSGDPADELSPFPADQPGHEWAEGRSDFDIPHRFVVFAEYRFGTRIPVTIGGRYRLRSGLPFTPGFRPGVDANGDGSGNNDPAFVDPSVSGVPGLIARFSCLDGQENQFAERNSCRSDMVHAFDLNLAVGLPVRSLGGRVMVTLDAFNLIASETGQVDRALVLVDPNGSITTGAGGQLVLPLIANPDFGKVMSRRTENRLVRLGFRLSY